MTTKNDSLPGIQARIEELQNAIKEKEATIKARTRHLKEELETELSPVEFVKRHPLGATGTVFAAAFLLTRAMKGRKLPPDMAKSNSSRKEQYSCSSPNTTALTSLGLDVLRSVKDLGFNYLQRYIDKKIR